MSGKARIIEGRELIAALQAKGILPDYCGRVVIDIDADGFVVIHYQAFGDERLLQVFQSEIELKVITE